jgi:DNA-binding transcriptional LysR family regulator
MSALGFDYDIHRAMEENNVTAEIKFSSMDDYAIVSMVANGLGISILPELVLKWCGGYVRITELEPRAYRTLGIAVPSLKNVSPAVGKFLDYAIDILKRDKLI